MALRSFVFIAFALLIALGTQTQAFATDPSFDVGVCKIEGAPGCSFNDGTLVVSNQSLTYYYRIDMQVTCGNITCTPGQCGSTVNRTGVELAPRFCNLGQTPRCIETANCLLRNCPSQQGCGNCSSCDNDVDDCDTANQLCTSVTGSITGRAWSVDGTKWTDFVVEPFVSVSNYCSGGNACD